MYFRKKGIIREQKESFEPDYSVHPLLPEELLSSHGRRLRRRHTPESTLKLPTVVTKLCSYPCTLYLRPSAFESPKVMRGLPADDIDPKSFVSSAKLKYWS